VIESGSTPEPADADRPAKAPPRWRRDVVFFAIAAFVVFLDQLTKWLVRQNLQLGEQWPDKSILHMRIVNVVNDGAAFGMLQGHMPFLIGTSFVGLAAIVLYYVYPPMEHGLIRVALGMQLGGAIGNLIDRVRVGEVTDFINVGRFPTFNVADSSISISIAAVLIFFGLQEIDDYRKQKRRTDAGSAAAQQD
jgi:signal peptidase II